MVLFNIKFYFIILFEAQERGLTVVGIRGSTVENRSRCLLLMKQSESVHSIQATKVLGDSRRLDILRLLMRAPATLTQLGKELNAHPAKVRHHLKLLEKAGFVELVSTNIVRGFVEKYYIATAKAYVINVAILPESGDIDSIVMMGSHDLALEILAKGMGEDNRCGELICVPVGSLDGLIALRQGLCQVAGCHLPANSGEDFNVSHVQHLFPGRSMILVTIGYRQQGILTRDGNPKNISAVSDLAREDVSIINRQSGSGTRLWLDRRLAEIGISPSQIKGYDTEVQTHHHVGSAISRGEADAGLGLLAEAELMGLDFTPLFEERYDLVLAASDIDKPRFAPLLDRLRSGIFQKSVSGLGGYNTDHAGELVPVGEVLISPEK
jgi:molybdate-binding protein/DNA-binding HxlR family transcriptional regulator